MLLPADFPMFVFRWRQFFIPHTPASVESGLSPPDTTGEDLGSAKTPNLVEFTRHHSKEVPILASLEGYIVFSPDCRDFLGPVLHAQAFPAQIHPSLRHGQCLQ